MKWFDNLRIKSKLLFCFITVAMYTAIVGAIGISDMYILNDKAQSMYKDNLTPIGMLSQVITNTQNARATIILMLYDNDRGKNVERQKIVDKAISDNNAIYAEYEKLITDKRESDVYKVFKENRTKYRDKRDEVLKHIKEGELKTANDKYPEMEAARASMATDIETLIALNKTFADEANISNASDFKTQTIIISIIILITIALAIGGGFYVARLIGKPIKELVEVSEKLALGEVDVNVEVKSKDEIGQLTGSFAKMISNIRVQAEEANRIASGDLNVEVQVKSDKDILSKSMLQVVETLRSLKGEINTLVDASVVGRLDKRADIQGFHGEWMTMISGLNSMLNTLVGHIDSIPTPVMIIDKDFTIQYMNIKGAELLASSQSQLIGRKCYDCFKTSDCHTSNCACAIAMQQSRQCTRETDAHPMGMNMDIAYSAFPLRDENKNIIGALELIMDQTAVKTASRVAKKQAQFQENEVEKLLVNIEKLAQGKLECDISVAATDEDTKAIGELFEKINKSFGDSIETLSSYVSDISNTLTEMANGNLVVALNGDYRGDFIEIKNSLNNIIKSFNDVLNDINNAASQVALGSRQMSQSAQVLSQGSTEQASSIQQLTASMEEISAQTKKNAVNANEANELALLAKDDAIKGNKEMNEMLKAMADINESSANISKIIKVIDEIAFQTNILALNAAVEAARAGQHGKGFAVVAEEVRNLAARSANAAKETTMLIEGSIKKAEGGTKIANYTAEALTKIVEGVTKAAALVGDIAVASNEQASGIAQVNQGIIQVSEVTQTNSATSQEGAAASEELSSQAEVLKEMVGRFTLKKSNSAANNFNDANPEVPKMFDNAPSKKKGHMGTGNTKSELDSIKAKILLSDKEFGKY
ncbi:methyl-accepting chemotaxis protein [Pseudobacteroides cellulosolvens]|uniref:Methyl-accepting chemotaxis sensory transducer with Pas/Pac sensor n=1 Tax=Pseudobacteroides cellulosolvens ATCC 35603 = DSM 2933 TaxID=398512 RepID=A0A0L6JSX5_9FIRM|nr:methyl-accepting chemotaxis protein [Pseudobacteroides cellulosolvens]KNY28918.1 methyl-accepting chemotaxis sensory transducer with Pas/Pac sensor [Pseudobacteroides cellulosolvens ATCC 35603 = DSM 2933]